MVGEYSRQRDSLYRGSEVGGQSSWKAGDDGASGRRREVWGLDYEDLRDHGRDLRCSRRGRWEDTAGVMGPDR